MAILPTLQGPGELRGLSERRLADLAEEIRRTIISTVATTGGHLGSSLGVVEITLALHRILESPRDRIVWDTGHQAYPHKLLTGRYARFGTLRQLGGVGGFPRRSESDHDVFDGGHAGTGLSIAAGLATARDVRHGMERIAVVVGDAGKIAITSSSHSSAWISMAWPPPASGAVQALRTNASMPGSANTFGNFCSAIRCGLTRKNQSSSRTISACDVATRLR